jgi:NitT/TauT family transport system ATP-binding protein
LIPVDPEAAARSSTVSESPSAKIGLRSPVIVLANVTQTFVSGDGSKVPALEDICLSVYRHEFVSIIGPSGCGKSTILSLIAGLLPPTAGYISIFGLKVTQPREDIGIVFQGPTLLPWLTVLDNVTFPIRHKTGRVDAQTKDRARQLLDVVGLSEFARKRPQELSGGMQQRVAIARSLLQDPDILLMDEPFSALDALTRDEMSLELLRILKKRPKTVVFVTHSIPEALLMSDRIVMLTQRPGRTREVIDIPLPWPRGLETMVNPLFNEIANGIRQKLFAKKTD